MVGLSDTKRFAVEGVFAEVKPFVVVGIPAFNEERTIARVVLEAKKYASAVIVCDDGSSDLTAEIADRLGADVVRHERNLGYGAALRCLFRRAREFGADVLVTLDGDGQHDPAEIPSILQPLTDGVADVVIGSRFIDDCGSADMPAYRRLGAKLITKMVNGSAKNGVSDAQSGFRAYGRKALKRLSIGESGMGASVELLVKANRQKLRVCEVASTCKYQNGEVGTSTEHPLAHGLGVVMSIIRLVVEEKPLQVLGVPSLLFMFAGIFFGVWLLNIYATTHQIVTNIALASLAFIVVGFFMLSTAVTLYAISRISKKMGVES
jgi:glycosyltransferase involved in cell wall biosynthesis